MGLEPRPFDPQSSALTNRPDATPTCYTVVTSLVQFLAVLHTASDQKLEGGKNWRWDCKCIYHMLVAALIAPRFSALLDKNLMVWQCRERAME